MHYNDNFLDTCLHVLSTKKLSWYDYKGVFGDIKIPNKQKYLTKTVQVKLVFPRDTHTFMLTCVGLVKIMNAAFYRELHCLFQSSHGNRKIVMIYFYNFY